MDNLISGNSHVKINFILYLVYKECLVGSLESLSYQKQSLLWIRHFSLGIYGFMELLELQLDKLLHLTPFDT